MKIQIDLDWLVERAQEESDKINEAAKGTFWKLIRMNSQGRKEYLEDVRCSAGRINMIKEIVEKATKEL